MKLTTKKIFVILCGVFLFSCNNKKTEEKFTVTGNITDVPDQKIFLEEVYFSQKPPSVIDTAELKNGNFSVEAPVAEEGMYRLRLQNGPGFIFINDKNKITASINGADATLQTARFNSAANISLYKFISVLDSLQRKLKIVSDNLSSLKNSKAGDSLLQISQNDLKQNTDQYKNFIVKYIDTTASPIVALFALGYTQGVDAAQIDKSIAVLEKKFPNNKTLKDLISQYHQQQAQTNNKPSALSEGSVAPDITMNDTEGKPFSLSSLKGKYVLVDFWASWCGPCRAENPNVVAAYKKFKAKNFTILGVSLDKQKSEWLQAIKDDHLEWKQISDLKFWNSSAVPLYNIESIPFNVLLNPEGKIIAKELRGSDLENKLAEVLK